MRISAAMRTGAAAAWIVVAVAARAGELTPSRVAERVDQLLASEAPSAANATDTPEARDEAFLRRASLDLVGRPANPQEIAAFIGNTSPDKRAEAVERLLGSDEYGRNWGRYWRDAILARRTEERAQFMAETLVGYLADRFNADAVWDAIARDMITATGSAREHGETALIMAHAGNGEEIAAEMSRIFLGVQIQCAQCHDHPSDRWKREQFHELAAFFARVEARRVPGEKGARLDFNIVGRDRGPAYAPPGMNGRNRSIEHFMPDLNDPQARGKLMQPALFLTSQRLTPSQTDAKRRTALASWVAAEDNPWFAKAFVNRIWAELLGHGFYEPIDDLGPDRECHAPQTLELLAREFAQHDYSMKWLFRTIMATQAYAQAPTSDSALVGVPPQRLRSDQFFDALTAALGVQGLLSERGMMRGPMAAARGPRGLFADEFGFDPSEPRQEQTGSIPQALFLMNAPAIQRAINGNARRTALGELLAQEHDDKQAATAVYLRALGREPSERELKACLDHITKTGNRVEAFEDILWCLVNSAEIQHRR